MESVFLLEITRGALSVEDSVVIVRLNKSSDF